MLARVAPWLLVAVLLGVAGARLVRTVGPAAERGRVVRVIDGDTAVVRLAGGGTETVRYIGIDTPEDVKPGTAVRCFSRRAARRNATLVRGRAVSLRFDAERRDRYGRLLAYVYRGPVFVNARLVAGGFAREYPFPPNTAHAGLFRALRREAQKRRRGLWRSCAGRSFS